MRDPRRLGAFGPTRVHTSGPRFVSEVSASGGELSRPPMDTHAKSYHSVYKVGAGSCRRPFSAALCSAEIRIRLGAVGMHTTDPPSRTNSRNQHGRFLALARQRGGLLAAREPPDATEGREHVRASDRDAGS